MGGELTVIKGEKVEPKIDPISLLTKRERDAMEEYRRKNQPPMSPITAANFFQLFVEGYSLEKILESSPAWGLGALADARIRYAWDDKRSAYIDDAHRQAIERMKKLQSEVINHISDLLSVSHIEFRQQMMKYLEDPKDENLPTGRLKSMRDYKDLLETLDNVTKLGTAPALPPPSVGVNIGDGANVTIVTDEKAAMTLSRLAQERRKGK